MEAARIAKMPASGPPLKHCTINIVIMADESSEKTTPTAAMTVPVIFFAILLNIIYFSLMLRWIYERTH